MSVETINMIFNQTSLTLSDTDLSKKNNMLALIAVFTKNGEGLNKLEFQSRIIIHLLKNLPEPLEFFLKFLHEKKFYVSAGSYFFTDVKNTITYDLYDKYDIDFTNCFVREYPMQNRKHLRKIFLEQDQKNTLSSTPGYKNYKYTVIYEGKLIKESDNKEYVLNEDEIKEFKEVAEESKYIEYFNDIKHKNFYSSLEGYINYIDNKVVLTHVLYHEKENLVIPNYDPSHIIDDLFETFDSFCKYSVKLKHVKTSCQANNI